MNNYLTRKPLEIHVSNKINLNTEELCQLLKIADKQIEKTMNILSKKNMGLDELNNVVFIYKKSIKAEIKFRNTYVRMEISPFSE